MTRYSEYYYSAVRRRMLSWPTLVESVSSKSRGTLENGNRHWRPICLVRIPAAGAKSLPLQQHQANKSKNEATHHNNRNHVGMGANHPSGPPFASTLPPPLFPGSGPIAMAWWRQGWPLANAQANSSPLRLLHVSTSSHFWSSLPLAWIVW